MCYAKRHYATGKMGSFVQERERVKKKESFGMGKAARMLRGNKKVLWNERMGGKACRVLRIAKRNLWKQGYQQKKRFSGGWLKPRKRKLNSSTNKYREKIEAKHVKAKRMYNELMERKKNMVMKYFLPTSSKFVKYWINLLQNIFVSQI